MLAGAIMCSNLLFGSTLRGYRNWFVTTASLFRIILGKFQYRQFYDTGIGGPVFLISFNILVNMILMNMYISVLNDAFTVVKEQNKFIENKYEVVDYIVHCLKGFISINKVNVINGEENDEQEPGNKRSKRFQEKPTSDDIPLVEIQSNGGETETPEIISVHIDVPDPCQISNFQNVDNLEDYDNMDTTSKHPKDFDNICTESCDCLSDLENAVNRLLNYCSEVIDLDEQLDRMIIFSKGRAHEV